MFLQASVCPLGGYLVRGMPALGGGCVPGPGGPGPGRYLVPGGGLSAPGGGVGIPACTEADTARQKWLLLRTVRILLECILVRYMFM